MSKYIAYIALNSGYVLEATFEGDERPVPASLGDMLHIISGFPLEDENRTFESIGAPLVNIDYYYISELIEDPIDEVVDESETKLGCDCGGVNTDCTCD